MSTHREIPDTEVSSDEMSNGAAGIRCPRCGAPGVAASCPKCGLVYDKYDPEKELLKVPATVLDLWKTVQKNWEDPAAHAVFVEQGIRHDAAGFVASCYRQKGDDTMAKSQLEKLTGRLLQTLQAQGTREHVPSKMPKRLLYGLLFLIIAILVFLIFADAVK